MRKLLIALIFIPGLAIADELYDVNQMYGAMNGAYNLRESRRQRFDSYANSGSRYDGLIAQLQMAKQNRIQREMLEEMKRQNDYMEQALQREQARKAVQEYEQSWLYFCTHNPKDSHCQ